MRNNIPKMDTYGTPEEDDSFCGDPTPTPPVSPVRGEEEEDSSFSDDTLTIDSACETNTWKNAAPSEDALSIATIDSLESLRKTSKSGKKVTFPEDELLVRVIFIPMECGPSMEELRPCDPESLVEGVTDLSIEALSPLGAQLKNGPRHIAASKGFEINSLRVGNGFMVNPITSAQFGTSSTHSLGRGLCIQGKPTPTIPKPAPRKRPPSGFLSATKSDTKAEHSRGGTGKSSSWSADDNQKRLLLTDRTSPKHDAVFVGGRNHTFNRPSSPRKGLSNGMSSRTRLNLTGNEPKPDTDIKHKQRKIKSASWGNRSSQHMQNNLHSQVHGQKLQGISNRQTALQRLKSASMDDLKPGNLSRSKSMSCDNLKPSLSHNNTRLPSASQNSHHKGLLGYRSNTNRSSRRSQSARQTSAIAGNETLMTLPSALPRIHQSPYRQSSLSTLGQRSVTFVDPGGCRDRADSARSDVSTSGGRIHAMKQATTPSATRKLYAWHMANGTFGKNALLETPSISPMLDCLPKTTNDPPLPI